jgi:hypothetical protein
MYCLIEDFFIVARSRAFKILFRKKNVFCSVVGLDLHGSALILVGWIRIRIGTVDRIQEGKKEPTKVGKSKEL